MKAANFWKPASCRTPEEFREALERDGIEIPVADNSCVPLEKWSILPMEGWDNERDGRPSELTRRRWLRFATSGAKLIFGTEAAAVMESGRSNTRQLMANERTAEDLKSLVCAMRAAHEERFGRADDLRIGLQLTHSGRFSHPNNDAILEARTAWAHPLLDKKFKCSAANVISDDEARDIVKHFVSAARVAQFAGFDFVDIKHAHGYLLHEFLGARERPGKYGGSFENRTRLSREIFDSIRAACPGLGTSMRLSLYDIVPWERLPDGSGRPMSDDPRQYAFGEEEAAEFIKASGVPLVCASLGSPYYNVHLQRPAYFPVSDGYLIPEHPLRQVARHISAVRAMKAKCPGVAFVAGSLSCLQEWIANVASAMISRGDCDFAGIGRLSFSYPEICADSAAGRTIDRRKLCRTCGECTNAPRAGRISGCYLLDPFYKEKSAAK